VVLIGRSVRSLGCSGEVSGSAAEVRVVACEQCVRHGDAHRDVVGELAEVLDGEVSRSMQLTPTQEGCDLVAMAATAQRRGVLVRHGHTYNVVPQAEAPLTAR
jgi:hypothetical protein